MQALQTSLLGSISAGLFSSIERCKSNNQSFQPELAGTIRVNSRNRVRSSEFLGQPDEKPFRPADVAEPIRVLILD
jgi:hypothetical protein